MKPMIEDVKNDIDKQEQGKEDLMTKFEWSSMQNFRVDHTLEELEDKRVIFLSMDCIDQKMLEAK